MKKKEKKYGLLKGILLFIFIAIILSWLIPNGQFSASGYATEGSLVRVGLTDLSWLVYYGFYFALDKIVLLLAVGGLYGVLVKTNAYDRLTTNIAKKLQNKKVSVVIISIILALLASLLTQTFTVIIFVPFIISIMNKMELDKMTILATTFGSIMVGVLGATYGTEGLVYFNRYITTEGFKATNTVLIRAGILAIGLVLFNFFTLSHMKRVEKKAESATIFPVEIEESEDNKPKKSSIIPIVIIGLLLFVIAILGFVDWNTLGVTAFDSFHKTLTDIHIGDFYVFSSLLGANTSAFGTWDLFPISAIIFVFTLIIGLCYRFKFNEFVDGFIDGLKKMIKPCFIVAGAFTLMVVVYMSPYVATIINKLLSLTEGFNLVTMSLSSIVGSIFHTDLGFTGYILGAFLSAEYMDFINPIYVIFTSLYGLVQFLIPTSIVLGVGLTALDIKYRDWLKHIWKFIIGMFICLLVIFILMAII